MRQFLTMLSAVVTTLSASAGPVLRSTLPVSPLHQAKREALTEDKPLCVWVGYKCPSSANQLPGFVHHHAGSAWQGIDDPGVVVYAPRGDGWLWNAGFIPADRVCAANLRGAVESKVAEWERFSTAAGPALPTFKHLRGWLASRDGKCVG